MGLHQGDKVYDLFSLLFCAGLTAFYVDHDRKRRRTRQPQNAETCGFEN